METREVPEDQARLAGGASRDHVNENIVRHLAI
jgi:hypothetical protein